MIHNFSDQLPSASASWMRRTALRWTLEDNRRATPYIDFWIPAARPTAQPPTRRDSHHTHAGLAPACQLYKSNSKAFHDRSDRASVTRPDGRLGTDGMGMSIFFYLAWGGNGGYLHLRASSKQRVGKRLQRRTLHMLFSCGGPARVSFVAATALLGVWVVTFPRCTPLK